MDITVREMLFGDWPSVAKIYQQGIETNTATLLPNCPSFEEWDASHIQTCRIVALTEGQIVGWAALTAVSNRCCYAGVAEVSIYIGNDFKALGIGKKLLKALCDQSEAEGFWTLQSGILQDNIASICLHEKLGFRMVGYREKIGKDQHGNWRDTVLMERRSAVIQ